MIPTDLSPVANHLWQSTVFAIAAGLLPLALRKNRAAVRYWIWFAASMKFLIPFSLLTAIGRQFESSAVAVVTPPQFAAVIHQASQPFVRSTHALPLSASPSQTLPELLVAVWLCGIVLGLIFWMRLQRQLRAIKRDAIPLHLNLPIPAMQAPAHTRIEPGVFGIVKPVLILPAGITRQLTPPQLDAVIAHELSHVRRKDNLTAAIHMLVEVIFWFHPLVWWIRTRLVAEREQACDEAVSGDPHVYAEAILNVCRLYTGSPLICVSGITGADLKRRIADILNREFGRELSLIRKLLLTVAGLVAVLCPIAAGLLWGQSEASPPAKRAFEVTSVKLYAPPGPPYEACNSHSDSTTLKLVGCNLRTLVKHAYGLKDYQLDAASPAWATDEKYEFLARPAAPATKGEMMEMLQTALADRFQLRVHWKEHEASIYLLEAAGSGLKLQPATKTDECGVFFYPGPGSLSSECYTLDDMAETLQNTVIRDRPVINRTGVNKTSQYQFHLTYSPDDDTAAGPSIFGALPEQLGLTLKAAKGPVNTLYIDQVRRPEPN